MMLSQKFSNWKQAPVEGQSLLQKDKKRRERKDDKTIKKPEKSKEQKCRTTRCWWRYAVFLQMHCLGGLDLIWLMSRLKISKMSK